MNLQKHTTPNMIINHFIYQCRIVIGLYRLPLALMVNCSPLLGEFLWHCPLLVEFSFCSPLLVEFSFCSPLLVEFSWRCPYWLNFHDVAPCWLNFHVVAHYGVNFHDISPYWLNFHDVTSYWLEYHFLQGTCQRWGTSPLPAQCPPASRKGCSSTFIIIRTSKALN